MLYINVADQLRQRIQTGLFLPGDRVPSLRQLSRQFKVSIATAQQAYRLLEDEGVLEARPQSGYYVRPRMFPAAEAPVPVQIVPQPSIVDNGQLAMRVLQTSRMPDYISLGAAVPDATFLPDVSYRRAFSTSVSSLGRGYEFPPGLLALRRQIAKRGDAAGLLPDPDRVLITNGCQEALVLSLRATTQEGDIVAVESPTFYGILQAIESLRLKAVEIPAHAQTGISLDALALALEQWPVKACIVTPTYNNPLGSCMEDAAKRELIQMLAQHDVPLIEDDIYGELPHTGGRPLAAKSFDRKDNVLYCSSFSKTVAPGLRVGWVQGGKYHAKLEYLKYLSNFATATPNQAILADFLAHQGYDKHLRFVRAQYAKQTAVFSQAIAAAFPIGTRLSQPQGGYLLWVEMPRECDALELFTRAAGHRIAIAPGPLFSVKTKYRHHIRLNAAIQWSTEVERAIILLGRLARDLMQ